LKVPGKGIESFDRIMTCGLLKCTIWDDVGTYLTSSIDPVEKASLIVAFSHFKKEGKQ
jgi:hypothetical protein